MGRDYLQTLTTPFSGGLELPVYLQDQWLFWYITMNLVSRIDLEMYLLDGIRSGHIGCIRKYPFLANPQKIQKRYITPESKSYIQNYQFKSRWRKAHSHSIA